MLRKARIVSQILFFGIFVLLLYGFNNHQHVQKLQTELFLQINPLVALITSIASRKVITVLIPGAVAVAVITVLLGRVFCGWICPLGAAVDFSDRFIIGKARHISRRPHTYIQRLKYVLLFALIVLSMFGMVFPFFMDPISIATRITTIVIDPALNLLGISSVNTWKTLVNYFAKEKQGIQIAQVVATGSLAACITFVMVFIGGFWDKRFWCQYVCPTGAFLGLMSRIPVLRRKVMTDTCNSCHACATRQCPVRAISHDDVRVTNSAECIVCGVCSQNKRDCTTFTFGYGKELPLTAPVLARRHFVSGILAGFVAPSILKGSGSDHISQTQPVRPPGSIPEAEFLTRCIACGECMKACPNHALQPCGFIDGMMKLNTPKLVPSVGYCEPSCTACTNVCPTVAIRPVQQDDKPFTKIGTAIVNKDHCLAWSGEIKCLICKKHCPYQAITEEDIECGETTLSGPSVNKDLCTGCGACEKYCAVGSNPAIKIYVQGERRISDGPVISDKKRARIKKERDEILLAE
ncbi:MAG: 4Fe-4S binding protein [Fibrobacterota bacterium]|nr:4Fe-4S binding protein [Chitinispirillaceae bacterium]